MTKAASRFRKIFWRVVKISGIIAAAILFLFTVISWIVFENKNTWFLEQFQSYLDEEQSGQLEIESVNLKLLKNFPDVTLELKGIKYFEHRDSLRTPGEQPILYAEHLFVAVELLPLMNDEVRVSDINLSRAKINIAEHRKGVLNIELALARPSKQKIQKKDTSEIRKKKTTATPAKPKPTKPKAKTEAKPAPVIQVDLESVNVNDVQVNWIAFHASDTSTVFMETMEAELINNGNEVQASVYTVNHVQSLHVMGSVMPPGDIVLESALQYDRSKQQLTIQETTLQYDVFSMSVSGTFAAKNKMLDLKLDASSNDLELLSAIIQPDVLHKNPDLLKQGDIYLQGRVFGELKNRQPQFDISFGVKGLTFNLPKSEGTFRNIGFEGRFISGNAADYSKAVFEVKNLHGQCPGGFVKGQFLLKNFVDPFLHYNLDTKLKLDGYDQIFKINSVKNLEGTIAAQANFQGPLRDLATHHADSVRSSSIVLDNVSFVLAKNGQQVSGLSGKIDNKYNRATIDQLTLRYGKNDVTLNATVDNLVYFLIKGESEINVSGNLKSRQWFTKDFILDTLQSAAVQDRITNLNMDFQLKTQGTSTDTLNSQKVLFKVSTLSATFDKLADIKMLNAQGEFGNTPDGFKLTLHELTTNLQNGNVQVAGDLVIPRTRTWKFNSRLTLEKFPWNYIRDLSAEIQSGKEPAAKKFPLSKMETITGTIDLSAAIITYPFDITELKVRNSTVRYQMPDATSISAKKIDIDLDELAFKHPENSGALTGLLRTNGVIRCKQLNIPGLTPGDVEMNIKGADDLLDIVFTRTAQKAKREGGDLSMDISKKEIAWHLHYVVEDADLEVLIKRFYKHKLMKGSIDYALNLRTYGSQWSVIKQNLTGDIEIKGEHLKLYGINVDDALKKFEKSQNFNLTDVGAVIIAGPMGLAVTKGTDFVTLATISHDSLHHTNVQTLLAQWKLKNNSITTTDVALATSENRIAFNGQIDFTNDSIPGLTIAVVDKNGCSLMDQKLYGKIGALKYGKINIAKTLLGSVINFVNAVVGKDCQPVYTGKIKAPVKSAG
ncbi:MAG TPA: AsmA-like C-terminal region-containing protein [Ohtaekwangia sp.]